MTHPPPPKKEKNVFSFLGVSANFRKMTLGEKTIN